MLDDFSHALVMGAVLMVAGVLFVAASVLSILKHGLGVASSGLEPWIFALLGGALIVVGRGLVGA